MSSQAGRVGMVPQGGKFVDVCCLQSIYPPGTWNLKMKFSMRGDVHVPC